MIRNSQRFLFTFIILIMLLASQGRSEHSNAPVIKSNNPEYVDSLSNPIRLNWTIVDDDLRLVEIYSERSVIDIKTFNKSTFQEIPIIMEFTLEDGRYNFTLFAIDAENNTAKDTVIMTKGSEQSELPELIGFSHLSFLLILIILTNFVQSTTKRYRRN